MGGLQIGGLAIRDPAYLLLATRLADDEQKSVRICDILRHHAFLRRTWCRLVRVEALACYR